MKARPAPDPPSPFVQAMTAALARGDGEAMRQLLVANGRGIAILPPPEPFDPKRAAANDRD